MASFIDQTIKSVSRHVSAAIGRVAGRKSEEIFENLFGIREEGDAWKSSTSEEICDDLKKRWKKRFGE